MTVSQTAINQINSNINPNSSLPQSQNNSFNRASEEPTSRIGAALDTDMTRLTPETFRLSNIKSMLIMHDFEPDDVLAIAAIFGALNNMKASQHPGMLMVSGGADARIQYARAEKYIDALQLEKPYLSQFNIKYARGCDSEQKYLRHGRDLLSEAEIEKIKAQTTGYEKEKVLQYLRNHPQTTIVMLKRLDELMECVDDLPDLSQSKMIMYAGQFNTSSAIKHLERFKALTDRFGAVGLVQNYIMLQNKGEKDAHGHVTPRDITPESMPTFTHLLSTDTRFTISSIRNNISIWNSKIMFEFTTKAAKTNPDSIEDETARRQHADAVKELSRIVHQFPEAHQFSEHLNPKMISLIKDCATTLDKTALMENGKQFGFRAEVLKNIAAAPDSQVVIADPLVSFAMIHPEKLEKTTQGALNIVDRFLDVTPKPSGNVIDLGVITGLPGDGCDLTEGKSTRISSVEHFLVSTIIN